MLIVFTLMCLGSPLVIEGMLDLDVNDTSIPNRFKQPGESGYVLGTDQLGRDQFLRLIYGGRVSLTIAYLASILTVCIGLTLGLLAGYYGRQVDDLISWGINTLSAIPPLFLLLIASAIWQPSTEVLVMVLAALGWVGTSRLVRGEVLSLKERDYVLAAKALGASDFRVVVFAHPAQCVLDCDGDDDDHRRQPDPDRIGLELPWRWHPAADADLGQYADGFAQLLCDRGASGVHARDLDYDYRALLLPRGRWLERRAGSKAVSAVAGGSLTDTPGLWYPLCVIEYTVSERAWVGNRSSSWLGW